MMVITPIVFLTHHLPNLLGVIYELTERLQIAPFTRIIVPGVRFSSNDVVLNVAPVPTTIGVEFIEAALASTLIS